MSDSKPRQQEKSAIVIGATGLVGADLVKQLVASGQYQTIYQIVRHEPKSAPNAPSQNTANHEVLKTIVVPDFAQLSQSLTGLNLRGADAFSTLGTTLKQAGSRQAFKQVDFTYNLNFARICKQLGVQHFLLLSATGADSTSFIFYNKIKGQLEQAVEKLGFMRLSIFQPSLLIGEHKEQRMLEGLGQQVFKMTQHLVPDTWAYRPIEAKRVAQAMCIVANQTPIPTANLDKIIYSNTQLLTLTLENPA